MESVTSGSKVLHNTSGHPPARTLRMRSVARKVSIGLALAGLVVGSAACTDDSEDAGTQSGVKVVVTTNILGDVVSEMVGDLATVETIMGEGSDPHEFQASAKQANDIREADVVVANGADFEEGLNSTLESAQDDGVTVCEAIDGVETLEIGSGGHDHDEEADNAEGATDPHFFTDPARMADAVEGLGDCMAQAVPALDTPEFMAQVDAYAAELEDLDAEIESVLAVVPEEQRILVTNHEVFSYFADRYGFEVAGTIIPSVTTQGAADAQGLTELADLLREEGVPAVFAETSSNDDLANALAEEVGDVEVVALFSESLGSDGGETYVAMMRTNAERIAGALG